MTEPTADQVCIVGRQLLTPEKIEGLDFMSVCPNPALIQVSYQDHPLHRWICAEHFDALVRHDLLSWGG